MDSALSPHLKVNLIDSPLSRWKITNSYSEHIKSMTAVFSGFRVNTPHCQPARNELEKYLVVKSHPHPARLDCWMEVLY